MKEEKPRPPGRPRSAALARKILEVTLRHLAEHGYSRMSIDGIAGEAGISKPTLYRRWSDKADLATAALELLRVGEPPVASGDPLEDLRGILRNFRQSLLRPNGMALVGTVLAEEQHTPDLLEYFRKRLVDPRRKMIREVMERAVALGRLPAGADLDAATNLLIGSLYARYLSGQPPGPDWAGRITAIVWRGLARNRETAKPAGGRRAGIHGPRRGRRR